MNSVIEPETTASIQLRDQDKRIRILAILPAFIPSCTIGVIKPLLALHKAGDFDVRFLLENSSSHKLLRGTDVVVFCRNMEPRYGGWLSSVQELNIPYIYELDDDLFNVPDGVAVSQYLADPSRQRQLALYVEEASLVRVYSQALYERIVQRNTQVVVVSGSVDLDLLDKAKPQKRDGPLKVVYTTSRTEDELSSIFLPAVYGVFEAFPTGVELHFWGHIPEAVARDPHVRFMTYEPNYDRYLMRFSRMGYDIGLAPLPDDEFHIAKSNNKFREYGACHVAGVYSDIPVYSADVIDGHTGLLVPNEPGAWLDALVRLIENDSLREQIAISARGLVEAKYSLTQSMDEWRANIARVSEENKSRSIKALAAVTIEKDEAAQNQESRHESPSAIRGLMVDARPLASAIRRKGIQGGLSQIKVKLYQYKTLLSLRLQTSRLARRLR